MTWHAPGVLARNPAVAPTVIVKLFAVMIRKVFHVKAHVTWHVFGDLARNSAVAPTVIVKLFAVMIRGVFHLKTHVTWHVFRVLTRNSAVVPTVIVKLFAVIIQRVFHLKTHVTWHVFGFFTGNSAVAWQVELKPLHAKERKNKRKRLLFTLWVIFSENGKQNRNRKKSKSGSPNRRGMELGLILTMVMPNNLSRNNKLGSKLNSSTLDNRPGP